MYRHMWRSTKLLMRLNRVCVRWDAAMASMYPRPWEGLEMARPCIRVDRHCRSWGIAETTTGTIPNEGPKRDMFFSMPVRANCWRVWEDKSLSSMEGQR